MSDSVDMSKTIIAKSDQLNADDLVGGPITGKIERVYADPSGEQPVCVKLDCWPQPYKPCKGMRRVLVEAWGIKGDDYVGRSLTLFRNPHVKYGGIEVGGIEISHMSHLNEALLTSVTVTRGKKKPFLVKQIFEEKHAAKATKETPPAKPKGPSPESVETGVVKLNAAIMGCKTPESLAALSERIKTAKEMCNAEQIGRIDAAVAAVTGLIATAPKPVADTVEVLEQAYDAVEDEKQLAAVDARVAKVEKSLTQGHLDRIAAKAATAATNVRAGAM